MLRPHFGLPFGGTFAQRIEIILQLRFVSVCQCDVRLLRQNYCYLFVERVKFSHEVRITLKYGKC